MTNKPKGYTPSKQVVDRLPLAERIIAVLDANVGVVKAGFEKELAPFRKDNENVPDGGALVTMMSHRLAGLRDRLVTTDVAYYEERTAEASPHPERTKSEDELRTAISELQEMVTGLFGSSVVATFKLAGSLPADGKTLTSFANEAADVIEATDPASLPKPRIKNAEVDLKEWAAGLRNAAKNFKETLAHAEVEARRAEATLSAKNKAVEQFDHAFRTSVSLLETLLSFLGEQDLANKVRPSLRDQPEAKAETK